MSIYKDLITKASAGEQEAFEEIYRKTYKKVYYTCISFLKNEQDAADVSQEVYITVMRKLSMLQETDSFESWLGKITVNRCKDFLKKNHLIPVEEEKLAEVITGNGIEADSDLMLPEVYVTNEARRKILMDILKENLSDTLFQTVLLFYFHDMPATEIAQIMDCPVGTVTSRLCIARAKIKEGVQNYEKQSGDKLHYVALVPVLTMLFSAEANAMEPVNTYAHILSATSNIKPTAEQAAFCGASKVSQPVRSARAVKTGGKGMLQSLKAKILAGVIALVVIGSGVGAIVAITNNDAVQNEESLQRDNDAVENKEASKEDASTSDEVDVLALKEAGYDNDTIQAAQNIKKTTNNYFTALKTGDIDTLLSLTVKDSDFALFLESINTTTWGSDFIATLYGDIQWGFDDEHWDEKMCKVISDSAYKEGEQYSMSYFWYTTPEAMGLRGIYMINPPESAVLEKTEEYYVVEEAHSDHTAEEMLTEINKVIDIQGCRVDNKIYYVKPDKDGKLYINFNWTLDELNLSQRYAKKKGEDYLTYYFINNIDNAVGAKCVGKDFGLTYPIMDAEIKTAAGYLEKHDFEGYKAWLSGITGKNYDEEQKDNLPFYSDLSQKQKEWVDKYLEAHVEFCAYEYIDVDYDYGMLEMDENPEIYGMFILKYTDVVSNTSDEAYTGWALQNECKDWAFMFVGEYASGNESGKMADSEEEIIEAFENFLSPYYAAIDYATRYIDGE